MRGDNMGYFYQTSDGTKTYYVNLHTGETKNNLGPKDIEVEGFITDLEGDNDDESGQNIRSTSKGSICHAIAIR